MRNLWPFFCCNYLTWYRRPRCERYIDCLIVSWFSDSYLSLCSSCSAIDDPGDTAFFFFFFLLLLFLFHLINLLLFLKVAVLFRSRSWSWIIFLIGLLGFLLGTFRLLRHVLGSWHLRLIIITTTWGYLWCLAFNVLSPKVLVGLLHIHFFRFISICVFTWVRVYCLFLFYDIVKDGQLSCLSQIEDHLRLWSRRYGLIKPSHSLLTTVLRMLSHDQIILWWLLRYQWLFTFLPWHLALSIRFGILV